MEDLQQASSLSAGADDQGTTQPHSSPLGPLRCPGNLALSDPPTKEAARVWGQWGPSTHLGSTQMEQMAQGPSQENSQEKGTPKGKRPFM